MTLKRREFLKIAGGASLAWPLARCSLGRLPDSAQKSAWLAALEEWVPTVCGACPGGCGILARVVDDCVVKVEGNPLHPLNRGRVCPKGQAAAQLLYNPARIRSPLQKEGDRSSGRWREIPWDKAIDRLASKLLELRKAGKAHTLAWMGPESGKTADGLISRFLQGYGTPNDIRFDAWKTLKLAHDQSQGIPGLLGVDFENTTYILSFGAQPLDNWPTSMEVQRVYGEKRGRRDFRIVQIEPRFSYGASRADKWIPLIPGTEGYLALGLALVIIREELYDGDFLRRFGSAFEDGEGRPQEPRSGFKKTVLDNVRLEKISDITGVPLRTIIEIAKEFASSRPAIALADYNLTFHEDGLFAVQAIHSLNALVGSIDSPGGLIHQQKPPLRKMKDLRPDETAGQGLSHPRIDQKSPCSAKNFLENSPYEVNCLMLSSETLQTNFPFYKDLDKVVRKVPFIVSFSPYLDETAELADLILPDTTFFEKWQLAEVSSLTRTPVAGVGRPVVKPLYQAKPFEDVILLLAQKMGGAFVSNFPWTSHKDVLYDQLAGLYEARRGTVFLLPYEEVLLQTLEERGWWESAYDSRDAFMKAVFEKGGWQDPAYFFHMRSNLYQNRERRFVFFDPGRNLSRGDRSPHDNPDYPLRLFLFDLPYTASDSGSNMPFFQETIGSRSGFAWQTWVEINPQTALRMNLANHEPVWVESSRGKIRAVVKIFPGIVPDVAAVPVGKEEDFPRPAKKNDPLSLLAEDVDPQTGMLSRQTTRVKVYRSGGETR